MFKQHFLVSVLLLLTHLSVMAQGWLKTLPEGNQDYAIAEDVLALPNNAGCLVLGHSLEKSTLMLYGLDPDGAVIFRTVLDSAIFPMSKQIIPTRDGNYSVIGSGTSLNGTYTSVIHFNASGRILWRTKHLEGDPLKIVVERGVQLPSGNYLASGYTNDSNLDLVYLEFDENGGFLGSLVDTAYYVYINERMINGAQDTVFHFFRNVENNVDRVLVNCLVGSPSNVIWQRQINMPALNILDGNVCVFKDKNLGIFSQVGPGVNLRLEKLNAQQSLIWSRDYPIVSNAIYCCSATSDGGLVAVSLKSEAATYRFFALRFDEDGNLLWENEIPNGSNIFYTGIVEAADGGFNGVGAITDSGPPFFFQAQMVFKLDALGNMFSASLQGKVASDDNLNCLADSLETGISGWLITAKKNDNDLVFSKLTDDDGRFDFQIDTGEYRVFLRRPNDYWENCQADTLTVSTFLGDSSIVDFPIQKAVDCPLMEVNIATPFLRRCFENTYFVRFCNTGTAATDTAFVEIILDDDFHFLNSEIPADSIGAHTWRFQLDTVESGECGQFSFKVLLDCDSTVLGETHCVSAAIFPADICLSDPEWSGALIRLSGRCDADSVRFKLENIGTGNNLVNWEGSGGTIIPDAASGTKALKICGTGNVMRQTVPAVAGKTYTLKFKARADQSGPHVFAMLKFLSASWQPLVNPTTVINAATGYSDFQQVLAAPSGTVWVEVSFFTVNQNICGYFDDFCLTDGGGTQNLPDYVIENLVLNPNPATLGQTVTATWTVKNIGNAPAIAMGNPVNGFKSIVRAQSNLGTPLFQATIPDSLPPGGAANMSVQFAANGPVQPGVPYSVNLIADAITTVVVESNEANNTASAVLQFSTNTCPGNLFPNGDFENGTISPFTEPTQASVESANPISGTKSIRIFNTNYGFNAAPGVVIQTSPNFKLTNLSFKHRDFASNFTKMVVTVAYFTQPSNIQVGFYEFILDKSVGQVKMENLTLPGLTNTNFAVIQFFPDNNFSGSSGAMIVDDVCLTGMDVPPPSTCTGNVLQNPGFENGNSSWNLGVNEIVNDAASGLKAAKVCSYIHQNAAVEGSKNYTLTFKEKTLSGTGSYVQVKFFNASWQLLLQEDIIANASTYQTFTKTILSPAASKWVDVSVVGFYQGNSGCVLVDDLCLSEGNGGPTCALGITVGNTQCNNNGTPNDPSDDLFTLNMVIHGIGNCGNSWTSNSTTATGSFDQSYSFGPFSISGGNKTITFTASGDPTATFTNIFTAPPPCSGTFALPDILGKSCSPILGYYNGTNPTVDVLTAGGQMALPSCSMYAMNLSAPNVAIQFKNKVYLSTNATLDASDMVLTSQDITAEPNTCPGSPLCWYSENGFPQSDIPANVAPGNYFILIKTDADNQIAESNETNNLNIYPVTVVSPNGSNGPDLEITMTADKTIVPQWGNVTYTITAKNTGNAPIANAEIAVRICKGDQLPHLFVASEKLVYAGTPTQPTLGFYNFLSQFWTLTNLAPGASGVLTLKLFTTGTGEKIVFAYSDGQSPADVDSQPSGSDFPPTNCMAVQDDEAVWTINAGQTLQAGSIRSNETLQGLEDLVRSAELLPNPAGESVFVKLPVSDAPVSISIYNQMGILEKEFLLSPSVGVTAGHADTPPSELDLSDLKNGVYFLKIQIDNQRTIVKKLIVSRMY